MGSLRKILVNGKTVIVAFDHGFEHGPMEYEGIEMHPQRVVDIAKEGGANAVLLHKGLAKLVKIPKELALIVKITGRTNLSPKETEKQSIVCTVEDAVEVGADAVAFTLYVGADREAEMLEEFAPLYRKCREKRIPLIGFMYPRGKNVAEKYGEKYVRYAARVGAELGVDIIKTYYTGDSESFAKVVKDACGVPVVAAGGPKLDRDEAVFKEVRDVINAGAAGVAIGRNIWARKNDEDAIRVLREVVKIVRG